jgi:imidazolonepropionase
MSNDKADIVILNASELLTLKGPGRPRIGSELRDLGAVEDAVEDGAVVVKSGQVLAVGKTESIKAEFEEGADVVIDAKGKLVMPGFVDCHNHLVFAGSREDELEMKIGGMSYVEISKRGGGILSTVKATRNASVYQLVEQAMKRLDLMLKYGTTTAEAKSGYGLNMDDELKMLKAIEKLNVDSPIDLVSTFLGAHALPPEFPDLEGYTNGLVNTILPRIAAETSAEFCDVFCDEGYFDVDQSMRILRKAQELGMKAKVHADELKGTGGAELAAEVGAVSAEHLIHPSDKGLRSMAEKGVIGVLLPASSYCMMSSTYADARRLIDSGVPVALATDLTPNSWTESMQFVISLACYNLKMLPSEAVCASTINAAHAISRGEHIGSLEEGKLADIIVLDVPNHMHIPYHFGVDLVERVIKSGRVVV